MTLEEKITAAKLAKKHIDLSPAEFMLKFGKKLPSDLGKHAAVQIDFYQKISNKIPSWLEQDLLTFENVNIEQSSSEATAQFKAQLIHGNNGLDLSGGLGVDSFFISKSFKQFVHNEPNKGLSEIVAYNFEMLGVKNLTFTQFLAENFPFTSEKFDWIYIDPSRRSSSQNKVFRIEDCKPDLIAIKDKLLLHSHKVLVKFSPILDLKYAVEAIKNVQEIHVVGKQNEVKELLFVLSKDKHSNPKINCVNLDSRQANFEFTFEAEKETKSNFSAPEKYLYEPNAAILKAGAFNSIGFRYGLNKLAKNSHLYTSNNLIANFPGRIFNIESVTNFDVKRLNNMVSSGEANISTRNFSMRPEDIRKKLKWKDGGKSYLFFTQDSANKKIVIITSKFNLS